MIFTIKDFDMTLFEIVNILKQIALTQPNVKSATDGSIYDIMNATNSVKYDVVHLSQTKHITDEETDTYGFNIFYVSRLEDSLEDNRLQIQSIGKEVLDNILRTFCENWNIDYPEIIFYPFTQKFADLCAGCYCRVEIEVPKDLICADDYIGEIIPSEKNIRLQDVSVTITENGTRVITPAPGFDGIGQITITTDVSGGTGRLQYKEVEYTQNGEYTVRPSIGYDGLSEVAVSISVPQGQGYEEGYEDGEAAQKAKLTVTSFTENNTYTREDGWSAVTVNVPSDYQDGYDDGEAAQKAKLTVTSFTENNTYTREDGWSAVTVNVDDRYDEGYADGFAAGASACSSFFITALTLNVDSTITDSGTATTTYSPSTAITDIYYTSSDPSLATIDSGTGVITVLSSGTITICAIDSITHLQDCKVVAVIKTIPGPTEIPYTADTSDIAATGETRCVTIDTTDLDTSTISLTYTGATGVTYVVNGDQVCITFPNNTGLQRTFIVEITADTLSGGSAYANIVFNQLSDIQTKWLTITYRPSCENPRTYIRSLAISNGKGSYDMVTDGQKLVTGNVTGWTGDTTYLNNVTLYFHLTGNSINADEFARGHYSETGNTAAIASVVVPYGVRTIGARAFSGQYRTYGTLDRPSYCGFSAITLPNTITSIGESAFANCLLLRNINLGDLTGLTQIATSAFDGMNFNGPAAPGAPNIVVPSGVRTIGRRAFASARLTSIVIPASVTAISDYGINIMSGGTAKSFTFLGTTPPTLGCCNFSWFGEGEEYHIYVPASAVNRYKTAWPTEADHITAITP